MLAKPSAGLAQATEMISNIHVNILINNSNVERANIYLPSVCVLFYVYIDLGC